MDESSQLFKVKNTVTRIRRNHALEHATIHILSSQYRDKSIIGRSDSKGFHLYTELPIESVEEGVHQAERRLRSGEHHLAIHPNCGTNLLTGGVMSAGAAFLSLQGSKDEKFHERIQRLPLAILGAMACILLAQPLGSRIQQHITTESGQETRQHGGPLAPITLVGEAGPELIVGGVVIPAGVPLPGILELKVLSAPTAITCASSSKEARVLANGEKALQVTP